jgi:mRNA-degrading endonuclease RelE of RelBE toxin-antitoxin system
VPYRIEYMPLAVDHLRDLPARDQSIVVDRVIQQLTHEPGVPTRNRKPLRPNSIAPWELRIGKVRVFLRL